VNSSENTSPFPKSDRGPPLKTSISLDLGKKQQEPESNKVGPSSGSLNGATWQDRAMNAPVSLPTPTAKMPPSNEESSAVAVQAMGEIFKEFIDVATSFSALKFQESTAKKRCDRRITEFEKSKGHHEKFPSIKDSQTSAKADAEKDYKAVLEKVAEKKSSLNNLAARAAEHLIPTLLARGGGRSAEQENLQQRVYGLERTVKGFEKLVEDQKTVLEEQRKAHQSLEAKNSALARDLQTIQEQVGIIQDRVDTIDKNKVQGVVKKAKDLEQAIQSLRSDFGTTKRDAAKLSTDNSQILSDLKAQAQKLEILTSRGEDIDTLRRDLKTFEETITKNAQDLKTVSEKLGKVDKVQAGLVTHVTGLATDQAKFRETWTSLDARVNESAKRSDVTTLEDRLQKLEKCSPSEVKESVTKELDTLKDRIKQIVRTPPQAVAQNALPTKPNSRPLDGRVDALEKRMAPVSDFVTKVNTLEKNGILNLKASDITLVRNEVQFVADQVKKLDSRAVALEAGNSRNNTDANLEERLRGLENDASSWRSTDKNLADFKKRVTAIEDHQQQVSADLAPAPLLNTSSSPSANMEPQFDEISNRIQNLEQKLDDVKGTQSDFETQWADVLNESIEEESQKLQTRIASLEGKSTELNQNLEALRESRSADKKAIVAEISGIFVHQPGLLPFPTIDQVQNALAPISGLAQMALQIQRLQESAEATSSSLGNLQTRVDNINTLDMANHILGKLYESHPDLQMQKTEALMVGFKTDLKTLDTRLGQLTNTISAQSLEARIQNQNTAEAMQQAYKEVRKEFDDLTTDRVEFERRLREAEKNIKAVTTDAENASKGLANLQSENEKNKSDLADQFATLHNNIEEELDKFKEAAQRLQPPKATSPAVSYTSNRSTQNQNGTNRGPKPNFSTGNRQPSTASGERTSKKRKLDNASSAKTNGTRPASSSGSPQRKKRGRKNFGFEGDDIEDDPDFEEEIPQPGVSSDEE